MAEHPAVLCIGYPYQLPDRLSRLATAIRPPPQPGPNSADALVSSPLPRTRDDADIHDHYFRVRRQIGDAAGLLARAIDQTDDEIRRDLLEGGSNLPDATLTTLLDVRSLLLPDHRAAPSSLSGIAAGPQQIEPSQALRRWRIGHQRFFVLLQALIVTLTDASLAHQDGRHDATDVKLHTAINLLQCSSSALRYTSDFPETQYSHVRATMTPPTVNDGFSGLQTRDHRYLIKHLRQKRFLLHIPRYQQVSHEFVAAFADLFHAHAHVCEKFGGATGPSLLMSHRASSTSDTALPVLHQLATTRLASLSKKDPPRDP